MRANFTCTSSDSGEVTLEQADTKEAKGTIKVELTGLTDEETEQFVTGQEYVVAIVDAARADHLPAEPSRPGVEPHPEKPRRPR